MGDKSSQTPQVDYDRLNLLGKAVYLTGQAARAAGGVLDYLIDEASSIIADAEKAFTEGLDTGIEEANVIEEIEEPRKKKKSA